MIPDPLGPLLRRPVVVAPMAGGPTTPALVAAAIGAGALGFLAAGYLTAEAMRTAIASVRAAADGPFGVNLFVPGGPAADPAMTARYVSSLRDDATRVGAVVAEPAWDDDKWAEKLDALLADPPPAVSFTFGCPDPGVLSAFRRAGSVTVVTVTSPTEARLATAAGATCLCIQGAEAGAHRGTFGNHGPAAGGTAVLALVTQVARVTGVPLIAAGGIMTADGAAAALAAGAAAVQCGTAFLRCPDERRSSGAQGGPGQRAVHWHHDDPGVQRQARSWLGESIHPRPPGRPARLSGDQQRHPPAARRRRTAV